MIEVQIARLELLAAVLAAVAVAVEDVLPCESHLVPGQAIEIHQQDDARNADAQRRRDDGILVGLGRDVHPVLPVVRRVIGGHGAHMPLVEQTERLADRGDLDGLKQAIENENVGVKHCWRRPRGAGSLPGGP